MSLLPLPPWQGRANRLYKNNRDGSFTDLTAVSQGRPMVFVPLSSVLHERYFVYHEVRFLNSFASFQKSKVYNSIRKLTKPIFFRSKGICLYS